MNNKILIGSIIVVGILIGVSFTTVVGYRSVTSDVKASPLFNVRSSRAIDEESRDLSCAYVGKGEESILLIPQRDNRTEIVQKIVKSINRMSDETFEKFVALFINQAQKDKRIDSENLNNIKELLHSLRNNDITLSKFKTDMNNNHFPTAIFTENCCIPTFPHPVRCYTAVLILIILFVPIFLLLLFITSILRVFTINIEWIQCEDY